MIRYELTNSDTDLFPYERVRLTIECEYAFAALALDAVRLLAEEMREEEKFIEAVEMDLDDYLEAPQA